MAKNISKDVFLYFSVFYILYVTLPLIRAVLPISTQFVSIIVTISVLLTNPKAFNSRSTIWLLLYLTILLLYALAGKALTISSISDDKGNFYKLFMEMAFILPSFAIMRVSSYLNDKRVNKVLYYSSVLGLFVSFLYLIPLTFMDTNILRLSMHAEEYGMDPVFGAPRYSLMHAYIVFTPMAILAFLLHKGKMRLFYIIFSGALAYMIIRSYIATTIILLLGVIVAAFLRGSGKRESQGLRFVVFCIVLLLFISLVGIKDLYDSISGYFEGSYAEIKVEQLGRALEGNDSGENELTKRQALHRISWMSFERNPIIGYPEIGNHSNILDRLGGMGLLCFVPYILFIISIWRSFIHRLKGAPQSTFYYNLGCIIVIILLYEKGLFSYEGWSFFAVILPISAIYLAQQEVCKRT